VKHDLFYKWSGIWMENYVHPDGRETEMVNQNRLVRYYEGSDGIATGSSGAAGYCIAATVKRSGGRFIYVALGAPNSSTRFDEAKAAFDYAFAGFTAKTVVAQGQKLGSNLAIAGGTESFIDVYAGQGFSTLIEKGKEGTLEKELVLLENIAAPIEKGQVLGYMRVLLDGAEIGRVDAVAGESVSERNFPNAFKRILTWWLFA
jgi:D-alanyl-D-alanine carboxypeptidase (penicillin-binding protein 5/6)